MSEIGACTCCPNVGKGDTFVNQETGADYFVCNACLEGEPAEEIPATLRSEPTFEERCAAMMARMING